MNKKNWRSASLRTSLSFFEGSREGGLWHPPPLQATIRHARLFSRFSFFNVNQTSNTGSKVYFLKWEVRFCPKTDPFLWPSVRRKNYPKTSFPWSTVRRNFCPKLFPPAWPTVRRTVGPKSSLLLPTARLPFFPLTMKVQSWNGWADFPLIH